MNGSPALAPAAALYRLNMERRRRRLLAAQTERPAPCPIISVGNITVGGTGKTPMVQWVARLLQHDGRRVAVVSRGYGGSASSTGAVVSDGQNVLLDVTHAGDEPVLHANALPGVPVVIGANRHDAVGIAVTQCGAECVVLDDGFQFWSLGRSLDLVLLDAAAPLGSGHLLPRGPLREGPEALERASVIVLTRSDRATPAQVEATRALVRRHSQAPIFLASHAACDLWNHSSQESAPLSSLDGKEVATVAAIAHPASFEGLLAENGAIITGRLQRRDHHHWKPEDFAAEAIRNAAMVVCTEKDAVKMDPSWFAGQLYSLRIAMRIEEGSDQLSALILSKLKDTMSKHQSPLHGGQPE